MRTPDRDRTHACEFPAVARSAPHADARVPARATLPEPNGKRWRHAGTHSPGVTPTRRA
jgi:hypothetical protein